MLRDELERECLPCGRALPTPPVLTPVLPLPTQVRLDKKYRLAVGSFREESNNYVEIIRRASLTVVYPVVESCGGWEHTATTAFFSAGLQSTTRRAS